MAEISVVIPVYMTESYLPRCIESMLGQTFQNFELILVDDGSPDESGMICEEYAKKDNRIKVIHQSNAGVSAARNAGLEIAIGQYVVFVDSDDWVDADYLMALSRSDAEFVAHAFSTLSEDGKLIRKQNNRDRMFFVNKDACLTLLADGILGYIVCKRFSMNIIRKYGIRFNEAINHTEDTLFILDYLEHARTAEIENENHYKYIRYVSRSTLSNGATLDRLSMIGTANGIICSKFFSKNSREYEQLFYSRVGYGYMSYINSVWLQNIKSPVQMYRFLSSLWKNTDVLRILQYAPDAIWKLSLNNRTIRAVQKHDRMRLMLSCVYTYVTERKTQ